MACVAGASMASPSSGLYGPSDGDDVEIQKNLAGPDPTTSLGRRHPVILVNIIFRTIQIACTVLTLRDTLPRDRGNREFILDIMISGCV